MTPLRPVPKDFHKFAHTMSIRALQRKYSAGFDTVARWRQIVGARARERDTTIKASRYAGWADELLANIIKSHRPILISLAAQGRTVVWEKAA